MRIFDPNKNPYADDLLRLHLAPRGRFSRGERFRLAAITASKMYKILPRDFPFSYNLSLWARPANPREAVQIVVIFDSDLEWLAQSNVDLLHWPGSHLIALSVGRHGVIEVLNGPGNAVDNNAIREAIRRVHVGESSTFEESPSAIPSWSDSDAASIYRGNGNGDRGGDEGSHASGGDGGNGGDGGDGGGDDGEFDEDDNLPGGAPGSGGVGELISHPVLFTVERNVFDAILEQV